MPGKISELAVLTGAVANGADLLETVDVSDTSMAASGTNKKMSLTNLMAFLNVNGVGASNEVFVGPNDPIATYPEAELWLDTDAVVALANDERWNTAWGIIGSAAMKPYSGTAFTSSEVAPAAVTEDLTVTLVAGRRYRFVCAIRAMSGTQTVFLRFDGPGIPTNDYYRQVTGPYHGITAAYYHGGSGTGTYRWRLGIIAPPTTANLWTDQNVSYFICEDVGPITSSGPTPQPTSGPEAIRPATPNQPMRFFATDTKREWLYDGTGWVIMSEPTTTYTPTLTNTTLGTGGSITGRYHRSDGWCDVNMEMVLGTGGTLTGQPSLGLPFVPHYVPRYGFAVQLLWLGTNLLRGLNAEVPAGGTAAVTPLATWGDTANGREAAQNLTATHPFTWATGCSITIAGRYRLNSRYS